VHQLAGLTGLPVPSQPPPLVTVLSVGRERQMVARMAGYKFTAERAAGWTASAEIALPVSSPSVLTKAVGAGAAAGPGRIGLFDSV
jgi:hypothetical protein